MTRRAAPGTGTADDPLLAADDLHKSFGPTHALAAPRCAIHAGEVVA